VHKSAKQTTGEQHAIASDPAQQRGRNARPENSGCIGREIDAGNYGAGASAHILLGSISKLVIKSVVIGKHGFTT
jgi:hypothetical protein